MNRYRVKQIKPIYLATRSDPRHCFIPQHWSWWRLRWESVMAEADPAGYGFPTLSEAVQACRVHAIPPNPDEYPKYYVVL